MNMSFEDFIKQEKKRLDDFAEWWINKNKENPHYFPMKMKGGEWDEQLNMFDGEDDV